MKNNAKKIVISIKNSLSRLSPFFIYRCDAVTVAPDNNKINVFKKGISHGSKIKSLIPTGGQLKFKAIVGVTLDQKKPQKNATKNIISEKINRSILIIKLDWTCLVWNPSKVASRTTSLNQENIVNKTEIKPK